MQSKTAIQHAPSHLTVLNSSHSVDFSKRKARLGHQIQMDASFCGHTKECNLGFLQQQLLLMAGQLAPAPWRRQESLGQGKCKAGIILLLLRFRLLLLRWNHQMLGEFNHSEAWRWDDALEGCAGPDWLLGMLPKGSWLWWKACFFRVHLVLFTRATPETARSFTQNVRLTRPGGDLEVDHRGWVRSKGGKKLEKRFHGFWIFHFRDFWDTTMVEGTLYMITLPLNPSTSHRLRLEQLGSEHRIRSTIIQLDLHDMNLCPAYIDSHWTTSWINLQIYR